MTIINEQVELAEEIVNNFRNFKKDGTERKNNEEYFKRQFNKLEELWSEFQYNHDRISTEVSHSDPYFTEKTFENTKETYLTYNKMLKEGYQQLKGKSSGAIPPEKQGHQSRSDDQGAGHKATNQTGEQKQSEKSAARRELQREQGGFSQTDEALRKQEANFRAFERTVANINVEALTDKWEFEDALKTLETRWKAIDTLHLEIDCELNGKNLAYEASFTKYETRFNILKKNINKKMWAVSHREKTTPTLETPIFSGNYNQWTSFKDLFYEAIHNNSTLSNAQKMQFLKSKVRGEAERLIQHLAITSDNYLTCWEILQHRYDNKKLIFTSHMNILFGLPNIHQNSVSLIKQLHDVTTETLNAIKNLGVDTTTWDPILVHVLCQKLDSETYTDYLESLKNTRELPILQELLDFLESKFTTLETSSRRKQEAASHKNNSPQVTNYKKSYNNFNNYKSYGYGNTPIAKSGQSSGFKCPLCKHDHGIYNCKFFLQMPNDKKLITINRLALCQNCLFSHNGKACNSTKKCRNCQASHNTILHEALERSTTGQSRPLQPKERVGSTTHVSQQQEKTSEILLATAQIKVWGADGKCHTMRALIDQGSQISLISEHAAQLLRIKREQCKGVIYGVGQRQNNCKGKMNITCGSIYSDYTFDSEVIIMANLIKNLPNKTFAKPSWSNIQNINLADPEFYISRPVDLLLGADIYPNILLDGILKGEDVKQPIAQRTQLGWLLCGGVETFQCNVVINNIEDFQQFWEMEEIAEQDDLSTEEIQCVKHYQETTTRKDDGKYEVRLPMKPKFEESLGTSKQKAIAQFRNQERKLQTQNTLASAYKTFMQEYLELKHMEPADDNSNLECYLPHHVVERAESTTTKYRVVFNASSKTSTGCSLNDLMHKGPNLQQDLQSLLLKWRQYPFAYTADIEKMYRQILIHKDDANLHKIIWRESPEQPLQSFKLITVTYGTKAAPFLAMMTLRRLAADERENFPEASRILEESFYMDDLVHGSYTLEQANQTITNLTLLLKTAGFNLRKWSSNNQQILDNINQNQHDNNIMFNFKTEETSKTLGLCWNPKQDKFTFRCEMTENPKLTKRILLSEISKIFDPLGWLAPVVTKLKLLFQTVWRTNIKWDEEVSQDIYKEWKKVQAEICQINEFEIPRWLNSQEGDVIELHGFCDASMVAYACVVYARIKDQPTTVLVAAKTKLVPLKKTLTLPRKELSGAYLLAQLMNKIKQSLHHHKLETYGWTDSKIVLGWLQGEPDRWTPFVANRVKQITEIMPKSQWNYVNTSENPSDAASRGIYASQLLKEQSLWKNGPAWLTTFQPESINHETFVTEQERKLGHANIVQQNNNCENIIDELLNKYSSFSKIVRIVAWIQRALTPKHKQRPSYLMLHELRKAKLTIIKHVQNCNFEAELEHLRKYKHVHQKSKLLNLNPFIDEQDILRVGGRLKQAIMSVEMKHPKIIPSESTLANLLINQAHKMTLHGGATLTSAILRQEYWITGGNNKVKKELRKCVTCRKHEGKRHQQLMGDLPAARTNPAKPFYHTGVDYTGFLDIKASKARGAKTLKGYVAVFICMVTKAVHLELVSELTSSAFLAALKRMAARRGAPRHMYSDQGTNFIGGNRALQEEYHQLQRIFHDNLLTDITELNIEWHFNAPAWPTAGGLWERAVRSLKHHLKRVVGEQKLTFEEYSTLLTQIEACLNSRPLCALAENIDDLDFLTPAHFLTGRAGLTIIETSEDARTRWHLTQKLFHDIWKRWKTEYLSQLTSRKKWLKPQQNLALDDVVVIHDDHLPPGKWALGRVIEVHPGSDSYVRVVTLKTKNGTIKRPVTKLSILPLENKNKQEKVVTTKDTEQIKKYTSNNNKSNFFSLAMMLIYFMSILTPGYGLKVTNLSDQQALYFDKINNMQIIRDEWKIIAYYDMNPYWEGITSYEKYYQHLNNICNTIIKLSHCNIIMLQLRHSFNELEHNNKVMLNQQLSARPRVTRGIINGVGYLANALFGVLDDKFAEQYHKDITLVRENQKHLAMLWKNQTSIVEAEYNVLQRIEQTMQSQHKMINHHLMNLDVETRNLAKQVHEIEYISEFTLTAMATNNILNHLKNVQDTLLDTMSTIYNGKINTHLINPEQLQHQLSIISGLIDKELTLPVDNIQTGMRDIYHLLSVKAVITKEFAIFEITVPLLSRDNYELYNLLLVPHQLNKNMITVIPIEDYVAMNLQKESYLPVSPRNLEHCLLRDASTYLCQLKSPIYQMKSDNDLCVQDETKPDQCKTNNAACRNKWTKLANINQYLYFCCGYCQLRLLCGNEVTAHQLSRANIVNIPEGCLIKMDNGTIYTHKQQTSKFNIKTNYEVPEIASINRVMNITFEKLPTTTTSDEDNKRSLKDIKEKIKVMKENEPLANNISVHDIHHYSLIYTILGIIGVTAVILVFRRVCRPAPAQAAAAPVVAEQTTLAIELQSTEHSRARNREQSNARVSNNEGCYTERGTTPVLRKVSFNNDV